MFAMTKLSQETQGLVSELISTNKSRSMEVSIALARVLVASLPMPTAPVDDITMYFRQQHKISLGVIINQINEIVVLDLSAVEDYCLKFYQYRYQALYPDKAIIALKLETALVDFFQISRCFDEASIACIVAQPILMTGLNSKFNKMLDELKA